jgi:hypothetical protein
MIESEETENNFVFWKAREHDRRSRRSRKKRFIFFLNA